MVPGGRRDLTCPKEVKYLMRKSEKSEVARIKKHEEMNSMALLFVLSRE